MKMRGLHRAFLLAAIILVCHTFKMPNLSKKQLAATIIASLEARYPDKKLPLDFSTPWQLMVATQLSAQCTDARVNIVTPDFFQRWPHPEDLDTVPLEEIEEVIRSTGFYHHKAKNIKACAAKIAQDHNGSIPQTMEELVQLPGVARKTANVVLYGAYGINEGIAVDTHVKRIAYRLGLTESQDPVAIEKDLMQVFPRESWGSVNHRMVLFGRDLCKAAKPKCGDCPFNQSCPKRNPPKDQNLKKRAKNES